MPMALVLGGPGEAEGKERLFLVEQGEFRRSQQKICWSKRLRAGERWDFSSCAWTIGTVGLGSKSTEQKDGANHARRFCDSGVHALREMDEGTLRLGGPRRYGERKVETNRIGW